MAIYLTKVPNITVFRTKILCLLERSSYKIRQNSIQAVKLCYADYGDPVKVVECVSEEVANPCDNEILLKMVAAPVNPADINTIQGKYPVKITLPSVPGNEGVAEVISVGKAVNDFAVGDRVVPLTTSLGTWRSHLVMESKHLLKVPKEVGIVEAATLTVNPCTAYRMLKDFIHLKPGDTMIQNGGNSACGQNVIQLCRAYGVKSINVVRNRPDIDKLKEFLMSLGASYVITEEELRTFKLPEDVKKPLLALNCIGGKNAMGVARQLDKNGIMVTYGGMSRDPVTIPTSALIFKNYCFAGFWMTRWNAENFNSDERWTMFNDIIGLMVAKKLQGPAFKLVPFDQYQEALMNTMTIQGFTGRKYILDFSSI